MNLNDISLYLPKYLSVESTKELLKELDSFPDNIDKRFYSNLEDEIIYQGDGIKDLLVVKLPVYIDDIKECGYDFLHDNRIARI